MRSRVYLVSSFTEDIIRTGDIEKRTIGGPAYYSGYTLYLLDTDFTILTSPSRRVLETIERSHEVLSRRLRYQRVCDKSFVFRHEYRGGQRRSYILERGCEIRIDAGALERGSWVIVSPVFREVSIDDIERLIESGHRVSVDLQGLVRVSREDSLIENKPETEAIERLRGVYTLHASIEEVSWLSPDPVDAVERLYRATGGEVVVVSLGRGGLVAAVREDGVYYIGSYRGGVEGDETGCGDILFSTLVALLERGHDPLDSLVVSSIVSGMRVERGFPLDIDIEEVFSLKSSVSIKKIEGL